VGLAVGCTYKQYSKERPFFFSSRASYEKIGLDMSTAKEQGVDKLVTALETFKKEVVLKDNSAKYLVLSAKDQAKSIVGEVVSDDVLPPTMKFRVPCAFVVPMDSPDWPPETWGMNLGLGVSRIRSRLAVYSDMDMERFASIGLYLPP
jgi:hypothetical protein